MNHFITYVCVKAGYPDYITNEWIHQDVFDLKTYDEWLDDCFGTGPRYHDKKYTLWLRRTSPSDDSSRVTFFDFIMSHNACRDETACAHPNIVLLPKEFDQYAREAILWRISGWIKSYNERQWKQWLSNIWYRVTSPSTLTLQEWEQFEQQQSKQMFTPLTWFQRLSNGIRIPIQFIQGVASRPMDAFSFFTSSMVFPNASDVLENFKTLLVNRLIEWKQRPQPLPVLKPAPPAPAPVVPVVVKKTKNPSIRLISGPAPIPVPVVVNPRPIHTGPPPESFSQSPSQPILRRLSTKPVFKKSGPIPKLEPIVYLPPEEIPPVPNDDDDDLLVKEEEEQVVNPPHTEHDVLHEFSKDKPLPEDEEDLREEQVVNPPLIQHDALHEFSKDKPLPEDEEDLRVEQEEEEEQVVNPPLTEQDVLLEEAENEPLPEEKDLSEEEQEDQTKQPKTLFERAKSFIFGDKENKQDEEQKLQEEDVHISDISGGEEDNPGDIPDLSTPSPPLTMEEEESKPSYKDVRDVPPRYEGIGPPKPLPTVVSDSEKEEDVSMHVEEPIIVVEDDKMQVEEPKTEEQEEEPKPEEQLPPFRKLGLEGLKVVDYPVKHQLVDVDYKRESDFDDLDEVNPPKLKKRPPVVVDDPKLDDEESDSDKEDLKMVMEETTNMMEEEEVLHNMPNKDESSTPAPPPPSPPLQEHIDESRTPPQSSPPQRRRKPYYREHPHDDDDDEEPKDQLEKKLGPREDLKRKQTDPDDEQPSSKRYDGGAPPELKEPERPQEKPKVPKEPKTRQPPKIREDINWEALVRNLKKVNLNPRTSDENPLRRILSDENNRLALQYVTYRFYVEVQHKRIYAVAWNSPTVKGNLGEPEFSNLSAMAQIKAILSRVSNPEPFADVINSAVELEQLGDDNMTLIERIQDRLRDRNYWISVVKSLGTTDLIPQVKFEDLICIAALYANPGEDSLHSRRYLLKICKVIKEEGLRYKAKVFNEDNKDTMQRLLDKVVVNPNKQSFKALYHKICELAQFEVDDSDDDDDDKVDEPKQQQQQQQVLKLEEEQEQQEQEQEEPQKKRKKKKEEDSVPSSPSSLSTPDEEEDEDVVMATDSELDDDMDGPEELFSAQTPKQVPDEPVSSRGSPVNRIVPKASSSALDELAKLARKRPDVYGQKRKQAKRNKSDDDDSEEEEGGSSPVQRRKQPRRTAKKKN